MTIKELYHHLNLMPNLQVHMLRVAGVTKLISDGWIDDNLNKDLTIKASLLHDLGNMAKFKLDITLPGVEPLPIDKQAYWKQEQQNFWAKYGTNAHQATYTICKEIGAEDVILTLEDEARLYFNSPTKEELSHAAAETLVCMYSDLRVMPHSVVTLQERVNDLMRRYGDSTKSLNWTKNFELLLQQQTSTDLGGITESSVTPLFDSLLSTSL